MNNTIKTSNDLCVGCNRCVRVCPIELANVVYEDENENIKVKIDSEKCITCGRCVEACMHGARDFNDHTELFFENLKKGEAISLAVAPSIKTNFPNWKNLLYLLKKLGVNKIYDVSLGADICIWAHLKYIKKYKPQSLITQPCPVIVSYIEMYETSLLKYLSPIQSPMACIAEYMKTYEKIEDSIAALSPCIAKTNEFIETKNIKYNITFSKLFEYIKKNNIEMPTEECTFDHYESGLGCLFPKPGGLKENLEFFIKSKKHIDKNEGINVFKHLSEYAKTDSSYLPFIYDVLNCENGCNMGSGSNLNCNIFAIENEMKKSKNNAVQKGKQYYKNLYKQYDKIFNLNNFIREYIAKPIEKKFVSQNDIEKAFIALDKINYTKQNYNCGACGSDTCYNMARKIALNINLPLNCVIKSRDTAKAEHEISIRNSVILQESLEKFENIWNNVECAIMIIDAGTRSILDANNVFIRMYGDTIDNIIGKKCHQLFCIGENSCPILDLNSNVDRSERTFINKDKESIPIIKSVTKINYNGKPALLECFTDITYLKKAEEQVHLLKLTEQANKAKSDFLSRMSHEMRTPMNAILGMTKIAENSSDISKLKYCLSTIHSSSRHLLGIINDILDMSKIEAGKFELDFCNFNIEKMLMNISNLIVEKTILKNLKFNINLGKNMNMRYLGDELRLSQVLTNLLSNAVKFTPEKGKIELTVCELSKRDNYSTLRFSVKDSGIGMSNEQIAKLFNAFEQADGTIARKYGGTGLGLSISKSIIDKMGGKIWVESKLNEGATFFFDIELERIKEDKRGIFFGNITPLDVKLLVVDNDNFVRNEFANLLDTFGIKCDEAEFAYEAILHTEKARISKKPYDIIYIDLNLPDMNAIDVIHALNAEIDKNTIIVMTTFLEWNKIESTAKNLGVTKYLHKPLFPSSIIDSINEALGEKIKDLEIIKEKADDIEDFNGINLLLAEDVEINREIFIALFEDTKINIDVAVNGLEALNKFKNSYDKYDIIVMDIQMPEMDGYQATQEIRALNFEKAQNIPILAMTANAFKEDVERCLACGMNSHLSKPINIEDVKNKIIHYCRKK